MARGRLAGLHLAVRPVEDHVAHREPAVELGAECAARGIGPVKIDRQLSVELLLDVGNLVVLAPIAASSCMSRARKSYFTSVAGLPTPVGGAAMSEGTAASRAPPPGGRPGRRSTP